jgi:Zn-dependent metalloprotease
LAAEVHPKAKAWNDEISKEKIGDLGKQIKDNYEAMIAITKPEDYDKNKIAPLIKAILAKDSAIPETDDSKVGKSLEDELNELESKLKTEKAETEKAEKDLKTAKDAHEDYRLNEEYDKYKQVQTLTGGKI